MLLLLSLLITLLARFNAADDAEDAASSAGIGAQFQQFVHPLTNMPGSAEDIETSYFFPGYTGTKFPIGETVTVLCHFSNDDQYPYNVTAIMGSLNSPYDFGFHIQNYSYKPIGVVVRPGEEYTFEYQFQLHPDLQPVEYALAHTIFYDDERVSFSTTFFNQTIELYYPNESFDVRSLSQLGFSIVSTVTLILMSMWACFPNTSFGTVGSKGSHSSQDDW